MLTAIISLSIVVVLVILLHVYARCILRRRLRRRAALRQLGIITSAHNVHTIEPPKTGLDPSIIASLPIFVYHNGSTCGSLIECSVCLSMLEDGEIARTLPNCKHTFHAECIDKWFNSQSTCPICRSEAEPRLLVPEPREGVVGSGCAGYRISATAPPLEEANSALVAAEMELGQSDGGIQSSSSAKVNESSSRLSSFRWNILTRNRSSRRDVDVTEDLERQ